MSVGYVKYNIAHLFTPNSLADFLRKVEAGEVAGVPQTTGRPSPLADAILAFIVARPNGVQGGEVVAHLIDDSRFSETTMKNATGVYNVLARLVKRGDLEKDGRLYRPTMKKEKASVRTEASQEFGDVAELEDQGALNKSEVSQHPIRNRENVGSSPTVSAPTAKRLMSSASPLSVQHQPQLPWKR